MDIILSRSSLIYVLDRALSRKKDNQTNTLYADVVEESVGKGGIVSYFWKSLSLTFEKELKHAVKGSHSLQQLFQVNYPRILRMFRGLFSNIELSNSVTNAAEGYTHLSMLSPLAPFENIYLGKSLSRVLDPVNTAFSSGNGKLPTRDDVDRITRVIGTELDIARFDLTLTKSVCNNIKKALVTFGTKCENAASSDQLFNVSGNATASNALIRNIEIINALWKMTDGIWKIVCEYQLSLTDGNGVIVEILGDSVEVF